MTADFDFSMLSALIERRYKRKNELSHRLLRGESREIFHFALNDNARIRLASLSLKITGARHGCLIRDSKPSHKRKRFA
jgi:hypothetical protein